MVNYGKHVMNATWQRSERWASKFPESAFDRDVKSLLSGWRPRHSERCSTPTTKIVEKKVIELRNEFF